MAFNHGKFMDELRKRRGSVPADLYADLMAALQAGLGETPAPAPSRSDEPAWLTEARKHIGTKEIPGPKHNPKILGWVKRLGGWFADDETPWCGTFVAHCMDAAGHKPIPKHWYRAKDWLQFGKTTPPRIGAIAVFGRSGGGHVGFVVGEDATHLHVLGGNQSNMVNVARIAKNRLLGYRWPSTLPLSTATLPKLLASGKPSTNEA